MNEFIKVLIEKLEELYDINDKTKKMAYEEQDWEEFDLFTHRCEGVYSAIEIVNQLAEEHKQKNVNLITEFLEFVADNAFQYDTDNGWDFSDLMELAGMFCGMEEHNNGWIACDERLPEEPKENPLFDNKPLELYLVSLNSTDYPFRAFWNGKYFTDGWRRVEPKAWQPLPPAYQPKGE